MKKTLLQEIKAMNKIAGTQLTKEQEIVLIKERIQQLNELDFGSQKAFDSYQKQHDLRGDTEVTVAGKKMSVSQAVKQSQDSTIKGSSVFGNNKGGQVFGNKSDDGGGIMGKIKDFVGSKGFKFGARRPNEKEDKVAADHFSDYENKKVDAIGVDKVTGNIYASNSDFEVVLSPSGKVLKSDADIAGKYNKGALDAYQDELEKDAEKYDKKQQRINKLKSLIGQKPDQYGDYRW
jgi:hypothetical protein